MAQSITIDIIHKHLESDRRWRERWHVQWAQNYDLYWDTVIINRHTQRRGGTKRAQHWDLVKPGGT